MFRQHDLDLLTLKSPGPPSWISRGMRLPRLLDRNEASVEGMQSRILL